MTMAIKPIETRYKGYRFRSRLEARWAVFFDAAKIRWDYEREGYFVNGRPYLPDFFLPDLNCFFEVKATSDYDLDFLQIFAQEVGVDMIVAEGGIPDPAEWVCEPNVQLRVLRARVPQGEEDWDDDSAWGYRDMFLECDNCGDSKIMNEVYSTMKENCSACHQKHARLMPLSHALEAARGARFEHGEKG